MAARNSSANKRSAPNRSRKGPMSDTHKAALAQGRVEGRAVREYLEKLRSSKPQHGRRRTENTITKRLDDIDELLTDADALSELKLIQERRDLVAELATMDASAHTTDLEDAFVEVARSYSERQGISYASWREIGVAAAVLRRAGVPRSS